MINLQIISNEDSSEGSCEEEQPERYVFKRQQLRQKFLRKSSLTKDSDRIIDSIPLPSRHILADNEIYIKSSAVPSISVLKNHFFNEGRINIKTAIRIVHEAAKLFHNEPNIIEINDPVTIAGDIHGQFYDLLKLFDVGGNPESTEYLFLGDYVDRGYFSVEVILYLFSLKLNFTKTMILLRGNHETRELTTLFTFKKECQIKYNRKFYDECIKCFRCLPLVAVINSSIICMHGGLSPHINNLNDISKIDRFRDPPASGALCDLLWSDPIEDFCTNKNVKNIFIHNRDRKCSYYFNSLAVEAFLIKNKLSMIIRAHQVKMDGYSILRKMSPDVFDENEDAQPILLITVFSAPNYTDNTGNKGAILKLDKDSLIIKQFHCVPHPFWLPNFQNAITFTLPFIAENTTKILIEILKNCVEGGINDDDLTVDIYGQRSKLFSLKKKIITFFRIIQFFANYRQSYIESILPAPKKGILVNREYK